MRIKQAQMLNFDAALSAGEGAFLPCSFWLADSWVLLGRRAEAEALFERLLQLGNEPRAPAAKVSDRVQCPRREA
jgi:hypothetical protein